MARVPHKGFDLLGSRASQPDFDSFEMQSLAHEVDVAQRMRGRRQIVRTGGAVGSMQQIPFVWADGIAEIDVDSPDENVNSDDSNEFSCTTDVIDGDGSPGKIIVVHLEESIPAGVSDCFFIFGPVWAYLDIENFTRSNKWFSVMVGRIWEDFDYSNLTYTAFQSLSKDYLNGVSTLNLVGEEHQNSCQMRANKNTDRVFLGYGPFDVGIANSLYGLYFLPVVDTSYEDGEGTINECWVKIKKPAADEVGMYLYAHDWDGR